jgi:transcriptional regulator with XRE-family HTH domain
MDLEAGNPAGRPGFAVVRIMLGARLRRLREAAGVSPESAAWRIRASRSKISRMEHGRTGFKARDLTDLLELYGVTDPQVVAELLDLVARANARSWWAGYADVLPGWFESYLGLEAAAAQIKTFDLQFVNGLFQTEDYARVVIEAGLPAASGRDIDGRIRVRMKRQELLTGAAAPAILSILDEAALRRPVGGTKVMRGQLRRLIEVASLPNVDLRVVPLAVGAHAGVGGSFTALSFAEPGIPDIVHIEQLTGAQHLERQPDVEHYLGIISRLTAIGLTSEQTVAFLAGASGNG